jgi:hypothetical protein
MKITRTTTKTFTVTPLIGVWKISFGKFKESRERNKQSMKEFERCFICEKAFTNEDVPVFAQTNIGNRFVCEKCAVNGKEE